MITNPHPEEEGTDFNSTIADEDVIQERVSVIQYFNQGGEDKAVAVKNIRKLYNPGSSGLLKCIKKPSKKSKLAVKSVSFGVSRGEIFGLLGRKNY